MIVVVAKMGEFMHEVLCPKNSTVRTALKKKGLVQDGSFSTALNGRPIDFYSKRIKNGDTIVVTLRPRG